MKKIVFSGMQATGTPSLANYIGAIKNWVDLQKDHLCLYSVVDLHSITVRNDPAVLRERSRDLFTLFIALGLDPEEHIIFYQSHVPAHSELAWILNCYAYIGELNRMTQFKDKSQKHEDNINVGLFTYPVLQAADILLYQANMVPVGHDQKQHLELSRDIAIRFNNLYGDIFTVPEVYIADTGARVMSLQEPAKKMSKSESGNEDNVIYILDKPDVIMKKFKRAVTDSLNQIRYNPEQQPGVSNLLTIYAVATNRTIEECRQEMETAPGYGHLKKSVAEAVIAMFEPFQKRYTELKTDPAYIDKIIKTNAGRAGAIAEKTLTTVKDAVGLPK